MTDRTKLVDETLSKLANTRNSEEIRAVAFEYFKTHDVQMMSYHHLPPIGAPDQGELLLETEGFPPNLLKRYIRDKLFLIDPIPIHAQKTTVPFKWSEIGQLTNLKPEQKKLMKAFFRAGVGDGYAFQVFGPGGRNGVFGFGWSKTGQSFKQTILNEIRWVCQAVHLRYCELLEQKFPEAVGLSNREREVLEWVARGKSNADIATIMGVSAHTVDAYLRRVFLKLGTTDRVTAAIRGAGTGIITGVV